MYVPVPLVLECQELGHSDLHFSNCSHFGYFLYASVLPTWFSLEPSYLAPVIHLYGDYTQRSPWTYWSFVLHERPILDDGPKPHKLAHSASSATEV